MVVHAAFSADAPALSADFSHAAWRRAVPLALDRQWNGQPAPEALLTSARLLWTSTHLWCGFECGAGELDVDDGAIDTTAKRVALWDRDVCEAFIWNPREPHADSYKEFEVAPTGQWCDLAIHRPRVEVDLAWTSGMQTAAVVDFETGGWRAVMRLPFAAFGGTPEAGSEWRGNLFRIGRVHGRRHYLALAPTLTPAPDFHVPSAFVPIAFGGKTD